MVSEGVEKGLEKGREEGRIAERKEIAKTLLALWGRPQVCGQGHEIGA